MKTLSLFGALLLLGCLTHPLNAQRVKRQPDFSTRHKNIYLELFGNNLATGVNFDIRLNPGQMGGLGLSAGIGGLSVEGADNTGRIDLGVVTFPIGINYLTGQRRGHFEAGVGLLPMYATFDGQGEFSDYEYIEAEGFGLAGGYINLGYRFQPLRNGVMFNFKWNPMVLRGSGFNAGWVGLGIGVGFK
jgi:hypothetical protein